MTNRLYFWISANGDERAHEQNILAALLESGNLFIFKGEAFIETSDEPPGIKLAVNCNDLFYWGCADYEEIQFDDLVPLFKAYQVDERYGMDKWCCKRRKQRPQSPIEKRMRDDGVWDDEMEELPDASKEKENTTMTDNQQYKAECLNCHKLVEFKIHAKTRSQWENDWIECTNCHKRYETGIQWSVDLANFEIMRKRLGLVVIDSEICEANMTDNQHNDAINKILDTEAAQRALDALDKPRRRADWAYNPNDVYICANGHLQYNLNEEELAELRERGLKRPPICYDGGLCRSCTETIERLTADPKELQGKLGVAMQRAAMLYLSVEPYKVISDDMNRIAKFLRENYDYEIHSGQSQHDGSGSRAVIHYLRIERSRPSVQARKVWRAIMRMLGVH